MKKLLSKNWKRIIYVLTALFIIYDMFLIFSTKNTIAEDFYKYGPDYEKPSIIVDVDKEVIKEEGEEATSVIAENTGMSEDLARGVLYLAIGILAILVISSFIEGGGSSAPAKKK